MSLQGIDISNWQNGINLAVVPCDFVIAKATEGVNYVSPDCARQVEQARGLGKLFGTYHYINGSGATAEADFYLNNITNWIGKGLLVVDWESYGNSAWGNLNYLREFIQRVIARTCIKPVVYASSSAFPWQVAQALDCATWVAQYADMNATGYQDTPWNEGAYACAIRQYSSAGRLNGYNGNLDLNKFYGDAAAWLKIANPNGNTQPPTPVATLPALQGDAVDIAIDVLRGKYGNGDERKTKLGGRYQEVQNLINHVATASVDVLVKETWAGKYGNGDRRKNILGARYSEVMQQVNHQSTIYTVQAGDTLSGIAAKYNTTWQHLAQANGLANPNLIFAGQRLTIN